MQRVSIFSCARDQLASIVMFRVTRSVGQVLIWQRVVATCLEQF